MSDYRVKKKIVLTGSYPEGSLTSWEFEVGEIINDNDHDGIALQFWESEGYLEEIKESSLVDRVDSLIETFCAGKARVGNKYDFIELYDYIVGELNKELGVGAVGYLIDITFRKELYIKKRECQYTFLTLSGTKEICQAMIDSEKMKPYLFKIFGVGK